MSVTRFPNIDVPMISVKISQSGATPAELETQVTKLVEDAVANLTGVKHLISSLTDGASTTTIEFRLEIDTDRALNDVKDAIEKIRPMAERVVCMNNLRNLRAAFAYYATDGWPQIPKGIQLGSMAEQRWWLEKTEKELGLSKSSWQCPTIRRQFASAPETDRPLIHYLPTPFSKEPNRANKSPQMP